MDPLSVAASVAGLLTAGTSTLRTLISASTSSAALAQTIHDELSEFRGVLAQLQVYLLGSVAANPARASMIDVDQLKITLTGCVFTFSELDKEVSGLDASSVRGRLKWALSETTIAGLVQRIQNHKLSLTLMLTIFSSSSSEEAAASMSRLIGVVEQLVESNTHLATRLRMLESRLRPGSPGGASSIHTASTAMPSIRSARAPSIVSFRSARRAVFDTALLRTRVYRAALRGASRSFVSLGPQEAPHTALWSVLSGVSLAAVSNISVLSLPVWARELHNAQVYDDDRSSVYFDAASVLEPPADNTLLDAARTGDTSALKLLLATTQHANLEAADEAGLRPLHLAAKYGHHDAAALLLAHGAQIDVLPETAFHLAARRGHASVIRLLRFRGADGKLLNPSRKTPIILLDRYAKDEAARLLLESGRKKEDWTKDWGWGRYPALHLVAAYGYADLVGLMLDADAHVDQVSEGYTPLQRAAKYGHVGVAAMLVRRGAVVGLKTKKGTALHVAAKEGRVEVVRALLDLGANLEETIEDDWTPLLTAAASGKLQVAQLLDERGVNEGARTTDGKTALHLAAKAGHKEMVAFLVGNGMEKEARMDDLNTPLHLAAQEGKLEAVKMLLALNANIEARNKEGFSPLYLAAASYELPVVQSLLRAGADRDSLHEQSVHGMEKQLESAALNTTSTRALPRIAE